MFIYSQEKTDVLIKNLKEEKEILEIRLERIDEAIEFLEKNPRTSEILDILTQKII